MQAESSTTSPKYLDSETTGNHSSRVSFSVENAEPAVQKNESFSLPWLRMQLLRLKSGLPVDTNLLPSLTVGMGKLLEKLSTFLDSHRKCRWIAETGEFGEGKSHFLGLAKYIAYSKGWAVCYLVANTTDGSLAQPQRHLQFALDTVGSPNGCGIGIVELFGEWWEGPLRPEILRWAETNSAVRPLARDLILLEKRLIDFSSLVEFLGAKILGARTNNPLYRRAAWHHLAQITELLRTTGHKGLVLLIDEVESIFRLATSQSWTAAMRCLGTYCCFPLLGNLLIIFVLTPQARQEIEMELPRIIREVEYQVTTPEEEKVALRSFAEELKRFGWSACPRLNGGQQIELALRIIDLHQRANKSKAPMSLSPRMRSWLSGTDTNIRYAVRTILGWLDSYT